MNLLNTSESKEFKNRPCIYFITNKINNKFYIGKTSCIYRRHSQYKYCLTSSKKPFKYINQYFYNSVIKYGISNFDISILEFDDVNSLADRELYWITYFNTIDSNIGYNLRLDSQTGMICHADTRKKMTINLKNQWKNGIRNQHSAKLKLSWNDRDRSAQSKLFSEIKTKYQYVINDTIIVKYADLKILNLHRVINSYHKHQSDIVYFKNLKIERIKIKI